MQVESILNPIRGTRDAQIRAGITPVNHARNNVLAVKEQSRLNALSKLQEEQQAAAAGHQLKHSSSSMGAGSVSRGLSRTTSGQYCPGTKHSLMRLLAVNSLGWNSLSLFSASHSRPNSFPCPLPMYMHSWHNGAEKSREEKDRGT